MYTASIWLSMWYAYRGRPLHSIFLQEYIFVHFREFLGSFADLDVDGRAYRALLGELKGKKKGKMMFRLAQDNQK